MPYVILWFFSWSNIHTVDTHNIKLHILHSKGCTKEYPQSVSQGHSQSLTLAKRVSRKASLADQDGITREQMKYGKKEINMSIMKFPKNQQVRKQKSNIL